MENKKEKINLKLGFTLLELLVVVLIIGILAAIAFLQYRNAVRKARVAEAKIALRALVDATDRYVLQHGDTDWDSLDDLDIEVQMDTKNWTFAIDECLTDDNGIWGCSESAKTKWESGYYILYGSSNYDIPRMFCHALENNGFKICPALGRKWSEEYHEYQL